MTFKTTDLAFFITNPQFAEDVAEGLTATPKFLKSKYFYDHKGDELFQQIMNLPEYYLTDSEVEILEDNKEKILKLIDSGEDFNLIDLGAGDAFKTKILLRHFVEENVNFTYVPIDISLNALQNLNEKLEKEIPDLVTKGICKEYLHALQELAGTKRKIIMFLGSSIGNFSHKETLDFLKQIYLRTEKKDLIIIGFDLKKDPSTILNAYNDKDGVTKDFNLNLLHRINRELGANFDVDSFRHSPRYDEENGEARSSLISKKDQLVEIPALAISISLTEGEPIHTEVSKKYSLEEIEALAKDSGFEVVNYLMDSKNYFTDSVWRRIN